MEYQIRKAKQSDLAALADVEACCFPVSEAASKEAIQKRLETVSLWQRCRMGR